MLIQGNVIAARHNPIVGWHIATALLLSSGLYRRLWSCTKSAPVNTECSRAFLVGLPPV